MRHTAPVARQRDTAFDNSPVRAPGPVADAPAGWTPTQPFADLSVRQTAQRRLMASVCGPAPVQRVLAHDQAIVHGEVQACEQLGGKLVFRLTGAAGDAVIVKFEGFSGAETTAQASERNQLIHVMAEEVIDNVPGMAQLSPADVAELQQLPDTLGAAAKLLKRIVSDARAQSQMLFLKKENVSVGTNLMDMLKAEQDNPTAQGPKKLRKDQGMADLLSPAQRLLLDPAITRSLGRSAAFDLFSGSNDRFVADPATTNLENIDFNAAGTAVRSLDQFDPFAPLSAGNWPGGAILTSSAATGEYARALYHNLFTQAQIPDQLYVDGPARALAQGMKDAVSSLKTWVQPLRLQQRQGGTAEARAMATIFRQRAEQLP